LPERFSNQAQEKLYDKVRDLEKFEEVVGLPESDFGLYEATVVQRPSIGGRGTVRTQQIFMKV
jgi:hypothetical protein